MHNSAATEPTFGADARATLERLMVTGNLELPLLPESSSRLLRMCHDQDCPPREIAEAIRLDQSIATHVLRIANSPMYCAGAQIVSLQQSVARLGIQKIREIVLIVSCQGRVFDVPEFDADVRQSFQRSLAAAGFAQEIARTRRLNVEDAFLSGLLHDIGRPVLLQAVADSQTQHNVSFDRADVLDVIESFRIAVGSNLIEKWKLPARIAQTVTNQLKADAEVGSQEAKVLSLATAFTNALLTPEQHDAEQLRKHRLIEQLNIYPDQVALILAKGDEILDLISRAQ